MNKVVHFEIPAKDFDRAKKFYTDLFGWQIQEWPGAKFRYGLSTTVASNPQTGAPSEPGGINGAIMEPTEAFENTTMITIDVPSDVSIYHTPDVCKLGTGLRAGLAQNSFLATRMGIYYSLRFSSRKFFNPSKSFFSGS